MLTPPTLTTARLILRPHRAEDFEAYAAMWAEPAVVPFIGEAGFHDFRRALTPSLEGTMEAGWVFSGAAQGKGYAQEAMTAALGWADAHRPGTRITCMIQPSHAASLHVAGTLGFVPLADGLYNGQPMALLERRRATGGA